MQQDIRSGSNSDAKSLTTHIYRTMRADILCCRLVPGERLRIASLQTRFDSSLSAVREALSRLSTEGLVAATDQRGFRVATVSLDDLQDVLSTRRTVEAIALRKAIEIGEPEWEAAVSAAYADLIRQDQRVGAAPYGIDEHWVAAHEKFHHSLISGCKSPSLIAICLQLSERTQRYRYLGRNTMPHRDAPKEHRAIFNAVLDRAVDRAVTILDAHFAETARILTEGYEMGFVEQSAAKRSPDSKQDRRDAKPAQANAKASRRNSSPAQRSAAKLTRIR